MLPFAITDRLMGLWGRHRTMTKIRGMKTLIVTVGRSLKALSEVLMLLLFLLLIFGILSVDMFSGYLRKRCFVDPNQNFTPAVKSRLESQQVMSSSPGRNIQNITSCGNILEGTRV